MEELRNRIEGLKEDMPYGYCHCGCGRETSLIKHNRISLGLRKGEPRMFIRGHSPRVRKCGEESHLWKGTTKIQNCLICGKTIKVFGSRAQTKKLCSFKCAKEWRHKKWMLKNGPIICVKNEFKSEIPVGFCQCGCGQRTKIAPVSSSRNGWIKGDPVKYLPRHHNVQGDKNVNWKGGKHIRKNKNYKQEYVMIHMPRHPRATVNNPYVFEHILIAEKALGKYLPGKAVVHHVNGNGLENHKNLVVCQDNPYHLILEQRTRAYRECGHATWRKCSFCKKYDDPKNLYIDPTRRSARHRSCFNIHRNDWKARKETINVC